MGALEIVGGVILLLICVAIVFMITLQDSPKGDGLSALAGGDSYFNKNQGRTRDAMFAKWTKYCGIAFFIIAIVVYAIDIYVK